MAIQYSTQRLRGRKNICTLSNSNTHNKYLKLKQQEYLAVIIKCLKMFVYLSSNENKH